MVQALRLLFDVRRHFARIPGCSSSDSSLQGRIRGCSDSQFGRLPPFPIGDQPPPPVSEVQLKLWNVPIESFNRVFHVNTSGVFYTVVAFLNLLDAANQRAAKDPPRPKSQVIIVASIASFIGTPWMGFAYAGSKAAVMQMAQAAGNLFCSIQDLCECHSTEYFQDRYE